MKYKQARLIQTLHHNSAGTKDTLDGQWLYQNVQIHNKVAGLRVTLRKKAIQWKIEEQMDQGGERLLDEDQWLLEVNLGDIEESSGEQEQYWLVAIRAAREAALLTRHQGRMQQDNTGLEGHYIYSIKIPVVLQG
jgi:hypothetical protein